MIGSIEIKTGSRDVTTPISGTVCNL